MTPSEITTTLERVVVVMVQISTAYVLISRARRDARESREDRASNAAEVSKQLQKQNVALVALHTSTNGLTERAEDLARELGRLQGKADEKANPTP